MLGRINGIVLKKGYLIIDKPVPTPHYQQSKNCWPNGGKSGQYSINLIFRNGPKTEWHARNKVARIYLLVASRFVH